MTNPFFERPIVNSPYECPHSHWELDGSGQPTGNLVERRRRAEFVTPIPKPKKRRAGVAQQELELDEGKGLSTGKQKYHLTSIINEVRGAVDTWRGLPESQWQVTPETGRLLKHWRHHEFGSVRPFFCQVEAVETAIWFTEVAQHLVGKRLLENVKTVNAEANPNIERVALKLATGAGKAVCPTEISTLRIGSPGKATGEECSVEAAPGPRNSVACPTTRVSWAIAWAR